MTQQNNTTPTAQASATEATSPTRAAKTPFAAPPCPDDDPRFEQGMAAIRTARRETGNPVFSTKP